MEKEIVEKEKQPFKEFMNQKEFARYIGNSEPYVSRLVKEKKIIKNQKNKIDVKKSIELLKKSSDPVKVKNPLLMKEIEKEKLTVSDIPEEIKGDLTDDEVESIINGKEDPENINQSKSRKEYYLSKIQEVNYFKESKKLIEVSLVERQYFNIASLMRDKLFSLKYRLSPQFAVMTDVNDISNLIDKELRNIFNELDEHLNNYIEEESKDE